MYWIYSSTPASRDLDARFAADGKRVTFQLSPRSRHLFAINDKFDELGVSNDGSTSPPHD
ncbi:MAG: hypothetical protein EXS36_15115 [Pedosphaera sp.]|nr:hypothetical protein [Pedosphaera sp.]